MKVLHYVLELMTGLFCFRCMRKRAARRGEQGIKRCGQCVGGWTILTGLCFAYRAIVGMEDGWHDGWLLNLVLSMASNYTFVEALETFVTNAIGIADYLVAGDFLVF
jgi:hypothetical protein